MTQLSDYELARKVMVDLEIYKPSTITVKDIAAFRRYLNVFKEGKHVITKANGNKITLTRLT